MLTYNLSKNCNIITLTAFLVGFALGMTLIWTDRSDIGARNCVNNNTEENNPYFFETLRDIYPELRELRRTIRVQQDHVAATLRTFEDALLANFSRECLPSKNIDAEGNDTFVLVGYCDSGSFPDLTSRRIRQKSGHFIHVRLDDRLLISRLSLTAHDDLPLDSWILNNGTIHPAANLTLCLTAYYDWLELLECNATSPLQLWQQSRNTSGTLMRNVGRGKCLRGEPYHGYYLGSCRCRSKSHCEDIQFDLLLTSEGVSGMVKIQPEMESTFKMNKFLLELKDSNNITGNRLQVYIKGLEDRIAPVLINETNEIASRLFFDVGILGPPQTPWLIQSGQFRCLVLFPHRKKLAPLESPYVTYLSSEVSTAEVSTAWFLTNGTIRTKWENLELCFQELDGYRDMFYRLDVTYGIVSLRRCGSINAQKWEQNPNSTTVLRNVQSGRCIMSEEQQDDLRLIRGTLFTGPCSCKKKRGGEYFNSFKLVPVEP